MKTRKLLFAAACAILMSSAFANEIDDAFEALSDELSKTYPEAVTQLGIWPDAYIGKLVPSVPPHFGLGVSVAGTFIDTKKYSKAVGSIINTINSVAGGTSDDFGFDIAEKLPLPAYAINARLGGIVLPFDIGLYGSYLAFDKMKYADFSGSFKIWSVGGDIRYALLQGSRALPKFSLGAGYIFTYMSLDASANKQYTVTVGGTSKSIDANINTNVNFTMHTLFLQAQLSKKFLIFVPYIGGRAIVNISKSGYNYDYSATIDSSNHPLGSNSHTHTSGFDLKNIQPQIYAGLGINLFLFQLTAGGAWNPRNNLWSVSLNACFKM